MDKRIAEKISRFPGDIAKIQDSLQDILVRISQCTKDGDDMQLRLLMPRFRYLKSIIDVLKGDMNDTLGKIDESDSVSKQIVMQQIAMIDSVYGQLDGVSDAISVSLKALDESDKQVLMAEIIERCRDLETAAKELK